MSDNITELNEDTFEKAVASSEVPVVVDFWAEWCGPCKMLQPIFEKLAQKYDGKVTFCKLNIDENMEIAKTQGVRSIPTLSLYKGGVKLDTVLGAIPEDQLEKFLSQHLSDN